MDDVGSVPGRRRTGLVLGWTAMVCAAAALLAWVTDRDGPRVVSGVLALAALVLGLIGTAFLRRAWSVPAVADDPAVVRIRGWADVATAAWAAAVLLRALFAGVLGMEGTWLDVVRSLLGTVLVVSYVGMLVLATRWRPEPQDQL